MARFSAVTSTEIAAASASCFGLVCDTQRTPQWQLAVAAVEVLERDELGRAALVRTGIDAIITRVTVNMRLRYEATRSIHMERESGDLKDLTATWTFEDLAAARTRASFAIELDPGRALSLLAKGPVLRRLEVHLAEQPLEGLRQTVEDAS